MRNKYQYGRSFSFGTVLITAGSRDAQANPTLASGDVKISKDGGAFANLASLPTVSPASGVRVNVVLSDAECQAKEIMIRFVDQTATAEWEEQTHILELADPRQNLVELPVPTGFDARTGVSSANISRTGYPNYSVIYTDSTSPLKTDFNTSLLQGALLYNEDKGASAVILGGYFFDDTSDTTYSVFGLAKAYPEFGIEEGGSTFINTNWTGASAEGTFGSGWTFIAMELNEPFPTSGQDLFLHVNPSVINEVSLSKTIDVRHIDIGTTKTDEIGINVDSDGDGVNIASNAVGLDILSVGTGVSIASNTIGLDISSDGTYGVRIIAQTSGAAVDIRSTETTGLRITGTSNGDDGHAIDLVAGNSGAGIHIDGGTNSKGIIISANGIGEGLKVETNGTGNSVEFRAVDGSSLLMINTGTVPSMNVQGGQGIGLNIGSTESTALSILSNYGTEAISVVGADGDGIFVRGVNGDGITIDGSKKGINVTAVEEALRLVSTVGVGLVITGTTNGAVILGQAGTGMQLQGIGGGAGLTLASDSGVRDLDSNVIGTPKNLGDGASIAAMLTALGGKTANAGDFDRTTDSQEAIADNVGLKLTDTVDGVTLDNIFQYIMSMTNGKFALNTPASGQITFYERDNTTPLFIVDVDTNGRTRV